MVPGSDNLRYDGAEADRRAIIHIGLPKTGTTTIQSFLALNADGLKARNIHTQNPADHPEWGRNFHAGAATVALSRNKVLYQNHLVRRSLGIETFDDQAELAESFAKNYAAFVKQRGTGLYVMSGEPMFNTLKSPDLIRALDEFLAQFFGKRTYLVYLREQTDWVASSFSQAAGAGSDISVEKIISNLTRESQSAQIQKWDDMLPDAGFTLRLMHADRLKDADLLLDFCAEIGTSLDGLERPTNRNIGWSVPEIRILSAARKIGAFASARSLLVRARNYGLFRKAPKYRLTAQQAQKVRTLCAPSNETLRQRYFPHLTALFPDPNQPQDGTQPYPQEVST